MSSLINSARLQALFPYWRGSPPRVTRTLVILCYYLYLGRAPESEAVLEHHLRCRTLEELEANFMNSAEFVERLHRSSSTFGTITLNRLAGAPRLRIDVAVDERLLRAFLEHTAGVWTRLGETEPHWSVVTSDSYRSRGINEHLEHFYATGKQETDDLIATLERSDVPWRSLTTCLEFGCGVGRVTAWLAARFPRVVGVDISRPHLALAERRLREQGRANAELIPLAALEDLDRLPGFDLLYSKIVLQHNPPPIIDLLLAKLFAKANPGGVLVFQVPTYIEGYRFVAEEYLAQIREQAVMEMHAFPQQRVFALAAAAGLRPLEVLRDGLVGGVDNISTTFVFGK